MLFTTMEEYIAYFQQSIDADRGDLEELQDYFYAQLGRLDHLIKTISWENFWVNFPEILVIDAKLTMLLDCRAFQDFSNQELIEIIEKDYRSYFKEMCGYDLRTETKHSMVFNIL